jgi:hypothetical protein
LENEEAKLANSEPEPPSTASQTQTLPTTSNMQPLAPPTPSLNTESPTPPESPSETSTERAMLDSQKITKLLSDKFGSDVTVHNYFLCSDKCSAIKDEQAQYQKPGSKDRFKHAWLRDRTYWWTCFLEHVGVFCVLCCMWLCGLSD